MNDNPRQNPGYRLSNLFSDFMIGLGVLIILFCIGMGIALAFEIEPMLDFYNAAFNTFIKFLLNFVGE